MAIGSHFISKGIDLNVLFLDENVVTLESNFLLCLRLPGASPRLGLCPAPGRLFCI
jgi:hypothetical protein